MFPFRKLIVWQRAHQAAVSIYRLSKRLPPDERYGLASQLRRAAFSVPTNIAEGSKRLTQRDFAHFVNISETSAAEVDYLLELITDLALLDAAETVPHQKEYDELCRMLNRFRSRLTGER